MSSMFLTSTQTCNKLAVQIYGYIYSTNLSYVEEFIINTGVQTVVLTFYGNITDDQLVLCSEVCDVF